MQVIIEENNYINKFFKRNSRYAEELRRGINTSILNVIENKQYKIKTVGKLKYNGKTIYEYKIALDKNFVCRVAYTKDDSKVEIFYISTNIIKIKFVGEVSNLNGVY